MTAMTADVASTRITADEFLSRDYPIGSELIDGVVFEADAVEAGAGGQPTSPLLPGFAPDVDGLFADLG